MLPIKSDDPSFSISKFASLMISRSCAVSQNLSSQQCAHLIKNATFRCWISKTILKYIQRSQKICPCTHRYAVHYTDYTVTILYTNKWEVLKYWRKEAVAAAVSSSIESPTHRPHVRRPSIRFFLTPSRGRVILSLHTLQYIEYIDPESPQNLGSYNVSNSSQLVITWAHSEESSRLAWQTSGLR